MAKSLVLRKRDIALLQEKLQKRFPSINGGGCGAFAYAIAKHLNCRIHRVDYSSTKKDLTNLKASLNHTNTSNTTLSAAHFIVEYGGWYFDGHKFHPLYDGKINWKGRSTVAMYSKAEMLVAVMEGGWNPHASGDCKYKKHNRYPQMSLLLEIVTFVDDFVSDLKDANKLTT